MTIIYSEFLTRYHFWQRCSVCNL